MAVKNLDLCSKIIHDFRARNMHDLELSLLLHRTYETIVGSQQLLSAEATEALSQPFELYAKPDDGIYSIGSGSGD